MANMIPISTVTAGSGGAATIDFIGIPQIYTDLLIKGSARNTSTNATLLMYFNGDTTAANYVQKKLYGDSSTKYSTSLENWYGAGYVSVSTSTANTFGTMDIYMPSYTANNYKSFSTDAVSESNASVADSAYQTFIHGSWLSTAPITSITISVYGGNLAQYSTFTLYGIRKY
jgi:hypothetical protein